MGVIHAGHKFGRAHDSDIRDDFRRGLDLMLCDPGSSNEGSPYPTGNQTVPDRTGEGHANRSSGKTFGDMVRQIKRNSCLMVAHRIRHAEDRVEKLAKSLDEDIT